MGTALYCFIFYPQNVVRLTLDHNNNNNNNNSSNISKSFKKYFSNVPGERDINGLQMTAILSTIENSITCGTDHKHRTAATLCPLETWFVSSYRVVNTVHECDNE